MPPYCSFRCRVTALQPTPADRPVRGHHGTGHQYFPDARRTVPRRRAGQNVPASVSQTVSTPVNIPADHPENIASCAYPVSVIGIFGLFLHPSDTWHIHRPEPQSEQCRRWTGAGMWCLEGGGRVRPLGPFFFVSPKKSTPKSSPSSARSVSGNLRCTVPELAGSLELDNLRRQTVASPTAAPRALGAAREGVDSGHRCARPPHAAERSDGP